MRVLDHANVVSLRHFCFSTNAKDELYLNIDLKYVPENVHQEIKCCNKTGQRMPLIYVKLNLYHVLAAIVYTSVISTCFYFLILMLFPLLFSLQICRALVYIHHSVGLSIRDIKSPNLLMC